MQLGREGSDTEYSIGVLRVSVGAPQLLELSLPLSCLPSRLKDNSTLF